MGTKTAKQIQYQNTHRKIFNDAMNLFQKESYENVTIRDICKYSNVSIGSFYHHYPSKEALINEGYHYFDHIIEECWKNETFNSPKEEIIFLLTQELDAIEVHGLSYGIQCFKNQLTANEKYIINEDRFFYQKLKLACERFTKQSSEVLTKQLLRCTRGMIYDWCLHDGKYPLVKEAMESVNIILKYYE